MRIVTTVMCVNMSNINSIIRAGSRSGLESWSGIKYQK